MASSSIASTNWKLISQYDNSGIQEFMKDMDASKRMIAGMSAFGGSTNATDPMIAKLGEWTQAQKRVAEDDRQYWVERARMRDKDLQDQVQDSKATELVKRQENARLAALDREHWLERARMRDQALRDEIQDAKLAGMAIANPLRFGSTSADNNRNNAGFQGAMAAQQIGFGVQDFASQMTNAKTTADGLGRGIMSVSNNVQMLGAAWGPTGLAVTAIGGAVAGIVLPAVIKWVMQQDSLNEKLKTTSELMTDIANSAKFRAERESRGGGKDPAGRIKDLKEEEAITLKMAEHQQFMLKREEKRLARVKTGEAGMLGPAWGGMEGETKKDLEDAVKNQRRVAQEAQNAAQEAKSRRQFIEDTEFEGRRTQAKEKFDKELKEQKEFEEKKNKEAGDAARERAELDEKHRDEDRKRVHNAIKADVDAEIKAENNKQIQLNQRKEDLLALGVTPNGMTSPSIAGTSAAASAINRAIAGSRSEENDRNRELMLLEEILKSSQRTEQKLNFKKAAL